MDELISKAKNGDTSSIDRIINEFEPLVRKISRKYFLCGGDNDDLMQEGLIGLYKALLCYKNDTDASFKTFATLCIERQIQTAVKHSNRQRNYPLNNYITIDNQGNMIANEYQYQENPDEEAVMGIMLISDDNPENDYIEKEKIKISKQILLDKLSKEELQLFKMFLNGYSYKKIAESLNISTKDVDNKIMKIKKSLRKLKDLI